MAVSPSYQSFVLEQLRRVSPGVLPRRMFGAVGLYVDHVMFAIIDDDTVYLKTDETTRADFEARGMAPFRPFGEASSAMRYHQLPEEILEDPDALRPWLERAIAAARRARDSSRRRK